jgi:hypothetical protein
MLILGFLGGLTKRTGLLGCMYTGNGRLVKLITLTEKGPIIEFQTFEMLHLLQTTIIGLYLKDRQVV